MTHLLYMYSTDQVHCRYNRFTFRMHVRLVLHTFTEMIIRVQNGSFETRRECVQNQTRVDVDERMNASVHSRCSDSIQERARYADPAHAQPWPALATRGTRLP